MCEQEFTMYFSTFSNKKKKKNPKDASREVWTLSQKKKKKRGVNKKDKPS